MGLGSIAMACLEHEFVTRIPNKDVMVVGCSHFFGCWLLRIMLAGIPMLY